MDDRSIVRLYWDRDERAISVTAQKYGSYCRAIAKNILGNSEDTEECVNDTYLNAWNAIPPHKPEHLATFLGKITRNLAFNKYKRERTEKRGSGETALILDELLDCVSDADTVEQEIDRQELIGAIDEFLDRLPKDRQQIFARRYWYADTITQIAGDRGMLPATVSKILERTRGQLKEYLAERGFAL